MHGCTLRRWAAVHDHGRALRARRADGRRAALISRGSARSSIGGMFDPADAEFLADPYPVFAALREQGPVHWHEGLGLYIAVSHAACDALLRNRALGRIWRDREPAELFPAFNLLHRTSILESEPPTHTRLRRLVAGAFARGHVERMRPWITDLADRLVPDPAGRLADGSADADLLAGVAEPLPVEGV